MKTKQELIDLIAAHDVAIYSLLRTKKTPSLKEACSKLASRLTRDQKKCITRFESLRKIKTSVSDSNAGCFNPMEQLVLPSRDGETALREACEKLARTITVVITPMKSEKKENL